MSATNRLGALLLQRSDTTFYVRRLESCTWQSFAFWRRVSQGFACRKAGFAAALCFRLQLSLSLLQGFQLIPFGDAPFVPQQIDDAPAGLRRQGPVPGLQHDHTGRRRGQLRRRPAL